MQLKKAPTKDGAFKVTFDDGTIRKEFTVNVKANFSLNTLILTTSGVFYDELGEDFDIVGGGGGIYIKEKTPKADKDVQITFEDTDSTGVEAEGSEWTKGEAGTGGVAEVNSLEIKKVYAPSKAEIKFTDGMVNETVIVTLDGTETAAEVASAIAAAFNELRDGAGLRGYKVDTSGDNVLFTSKHEYADKNVTITMTKK
ncbi:hypothetical protein [Brevibacillus parabrevis]|uniref:hypothetical protein n=1 Tax=Brevibacillus parabrevis TaxID=54914 RepID=UPI0028D27884|nr:hypothetical protein [Brevibacillus parabrevis]